MTFNASGKTFTLSEMRFDAQRQVSIDTMFHVPFRSSLRRKITIQWRCLEHLE